MPPGSAARSALEAGGSATDEAGKVPVGTSGPLTASTRAAPARAPTVSRTIARSTAISFELRRRAVVACTQYAYHRASWSAANSKPRLPPRYLLFECLPLPRVSDVGVGDGARLRRVAACERGRDARSGRRTGLVRAEAREESHVDRAAVRHVRQDGLQRLIADLGRQAARPYCGSGRIALHPGRRDDRHSGRPLRRVAAPLGPF